MCLCSSFAVAELSCVELRSFRKVTLVWLSRWLWLVWAIVCVMTCLVTPKTFDVRKIIVSSAWSAVLAYIASPATKCSWFGTHVNSFMVGYIWLWNHLAALFTFDAWPRQQSFAFLTVLHMPSVICRASRYTAWRCFFRQLFVLMFYANMFT